MIFSLPKKSFQYIINGNGGYKGWFGYKVSGR